jgi:hypothetical protein
MVLQWLVFQKLSIDFATHTRTPLRGSEKTVLVIPVGGYKCESKNRLRAFEKLTIEVPSGDIPHFISIQETEIFCGPKRGLIDPRPFIQVQNDHDDLNYFIFIR